MNNKLKALVELGDHDTKMLGAILQSLHKIPDTIRKEHDISSFQEWSKLRLILLTMDISDAREFIQELFNINEPKEDSEEGDRQVCERERAKLVQIFGNEYLTTYN